MNYEDKIASHVDQLSVGGFRHSNLGTEDGKIILNLMKAAYNAGKKHRDEDHNQSDSAYYGTFKEKTFTDFLKKKFK
jgi:hypothetical protein